MFLSKLLLKGVVLTLFPTGVKFFVVFPLKAGKAMGGVESDVLTQVLCTVL